MTPTTGRAPERKRRDAYHHGNLRQALVDQAVRTIRADGVDALTLRDVGEHLRVSRTALYRHFADKQALLVAVATEGFRAFRQALAEAWAGAGRGRDGFQAMGRAYIGFAMQNPSHYRVMFGGYVAQGACGAELAAESDAGFRVLLDALVELQQTGLVRGDPRTTWRCSCGVPCTARRCWRSAARAGGRRRRPMRLLPTRPNGCGTP
ncbi:MAG: TetR/AcrR family transcriptional regulator [Vicinamibacterales bacterium]